VHWLVIRVLLVEDLAPVLGAGIARCGCPLAGGGARWSSIGAPAIRGGVMRAAPTPSRPALRLPVRVAALLATAVLAFVPALPAEAELLGSIKGVVTAGGQPVANAWVAAMPVTSTGGWAGRGLLTSTDAQGRYSFPDVEAPRVKVQARAPATAQWSSTYWPRAFSFADAEVLRVAPSGSEADIELAPAGSVRGTVVAGDSGEPLAGSRVSAHVVTADGVEEVGLPGLVTGPGEFLIDSLPPVPVVLQVTPPLKGNFLGQWFDDAGYAEVATALDGSTRTTGLRIALRRGAELVGTVRDDTGQPVAGARVVLTRCPVLCPIATTTGDDGTYRFTSVPPGPVLMLRVTEPGRGLLEGWYHRPGEAGEARLTVRAGEVLSGLDVTLVRGAYLTATVVDDATGAPIPGSSAELLPVDNAVLGFLPSVRDQLQIRGWSGQLAPTRSTGSAESTDGAGAPAEGASRARAGVLRFGPVPPGEYRLVLYPGFDNARYVPTVWGEPTGIDASGVIRLSAGQDVTATIPLVGKGPAGDGHGRQEAPEASPGRCPQSVGSGLSTGADGAAGGTADGRHAWPGAFVGFLGPGPDWAIGHPPSSGAAPSPRTAAG
jgi:hypothetical protein